MAPSRPSAWQSACVPMTPAAGPDFEHAHAVRLRLLGLVEPAGRLHDQERARKTAGADVVVDLGEIAPHARPDIGVGGDRRAALELAVFLAELVRGGYEQPGVARLEQLLGAPLVRRIDVRVEKQDRNRLDAELHELAAERGDLFILERVQGLAFRQHALVDLEAQRAFDQRHVLAEIEIVGVRPVDAADLVDVAEALRDDERGLGAGALQDGVDRDRRAMQEEARRRVVAAGLGDAGVDPLDQALRRGQHLAEREPAGLVVEHRDVREGAADVGGEAQGGRGGDRTRRGRHRRRVNGGFAMFKSTRSSLPARTGVGWVERSETHRFTANS